MGLHNSDYESDCEFGSFEVEDIQGIDPNSSCSSPGIDFQLTEIKKEAVDQLLDIFEKNVKI